MANFIPFRGSGSARRYVNTQTGETISYRQYFRLTHDGMDQRQYAALRAESPQNAHLIQLYRDNNRGLSGLQLALKTLKESKKGRDRRLALIPFYPSAEYAPDSNY